MHPLRVGLIGLGSIASKAHLPTLASLAEAGEIEIKALCDLDADRLAEKAAAYGVPNTYTDHRAMFDREPLDAVYVCIPPTAHTDQITIAADKGMGVLVEKPQTLNMAQAVAFDDAIRAAGVVSQVGFMSRYQPASEFIRKALRVRTPRHALVHHLHRGEPRRYWTSRVELCGGAFVESTIHPVDLLRYFLGDIAAVSAFYVERPPDAGPEPLNMPYVYNVNFRFAGGVTANVTTSRCLYEKAGTRQQFLLVSDDSLLEWTARQVKENGEVVWEDTEETNPWKRQTGDFIAAVRAGDPTRVRSPYSEALNSLAAVLGANASAARGGELVDLADYTAAATGS